MLMVAALTVAAGAPAVFAHQGPPRAASAQGAGRQGAAPQPVRFFVTSVPKGDGANDGGLAGADAYCQTRAAAAGRGDGRWGACYRAFELSSPLKQTRSS